MWRMYNEAVSHQRKGWRNKTELRDAAIAFMLYSASKGDIDLPTEK